MSQNNFPWLFSNVMDASWREDHSEQTPKMDPRDQQIQDTLPYFIMTVQGVKIACIGLVEECVALLMQRMARYRTRLSGPV